ncbi:MAG: SDR family NAD(P)-dependent oxidoreductase [Firmicutes bacterium]|nr:SDR family NAD(P)-dependent oxidoreductase [Candidatus Caballimonas caccae]
MYSFVSGATGGIGKAFSKELAFLGNNLFLTGRSEEKLNKLKEELLKVNSNIDILTFACDLAVEEERAKLIENIESRGIKIGRICNVAGVDIQKAFCDYTLSKVLFQIRVNVEATITLTHELLKFKSDKLEIVTISSMSGVSPMPYFAIYSATKCCLTNFFTALHYELKGEGIKCTVVLPGGVPTRPDIIEDIKGQGLWGKLSVQTPEKIAKKSLKAVRKNKVKLIPGFFNKFLYCVMKIAPKGIVLRFIARRWKKQTKDAF